MYFLGVLSVIICNICQVYFARAFGYVIDFFSQNEIPKWLVKDSAEQTFIFLFITIVVARVFLMIGRFGWRLTMARQTHLAAGDLKRRIWDSARYFSDDDLVDNYPKGVLMNAANSDVGQARFIFGFTLVGLIDVIFLGLFTLISMVQINLLLTCASLLMLFFTPIAIRKLSQKEVVNYEVAQKFLSSFNDLTSQAVSTVKLQKLGQTGKFWFNRLFKSAEEYRSKRLEANYTSLKYIPYMGMTSIVSYVVLFSLGVYLNIQGQLSVGQFVAMQGLIFLLQDPMIELGYIISEWRKSGTSLKRLDDIYSNDREEFLLQDDKKIEKSQDVYSVKGLNFSYGDTQVLNDFELEIKKGARVGIAGQIGTGKSTLVKILSGLERKFEGEVKFYGEEFWQYGHKELREHIVCVHQKPFLFADSIKANIAMDLNLTDEEVWHYLDLAGLKNDVEGFDEGLECQLGEWGINLSGGQKQRLTLARALARKPKVLLLDDGLSAVDTVTEGVILKNLDNELKDTTIIWVAHRLSTLKYCDEIINMDRLCQQTVTLQ